MLESLSRAFWHENRVFGMAQRRSVSLMQGHLLTQKELSPTFCRFATI